MTPNKWGLSGQTLYKETWNLRTNSKPNLDSSQKNRCKKTPQYACLWLFCQSEKTNSMFLKCES